MKDFRVLHVVTSLEQGGMENGVCNLARALAARGIQTSVACLERSGPFAERLPDSSTVDVLGKTRGFSPKAIFALWRVIRRRRPRVVHTHNLGPLIYGALATCWGRSPALLHGEHSQLAPWEMTNRRLSQRRRFYRACRAIHTVSVPQRDELAQLGLPAERIVAIPNGVDTARFNPGDRAAARALLSLPADAIVIGLSGRFGPHKGHAVLLRAFEKIAPAIPSAWLLFLGAGGSEESAIARAVAAHPHRDRIRPAGFRPDPERCYPALDLLAVPSTNEGMSNAAIEAMACGIPVLANSGTGSEAIITHNLDGWVADLRDPDALAARSIEILADRPALTAASENARRAVESRFSLGQMVAAYERLYRHLAE